MDTLPDGWAIKPLRSVVNPGRPISYGVVQTGDYVVGGIPCVRVVDLTSGNLSPSNMITTTEEISRSYSRTILQPNDIMFALRGEIGFVAKVPPELKGANLTRGVALIAPGEDVDPDFLVQALCSEVVRIGIMQRVNGSALREIPLSELRKVMIPLPPLPEQRRIAEILGAWDDAIALTGRLIDALKRRKQGLMQRLLTGRVRFARFRSSSIDNGSLPIDWRRARFDTVFERIYRPVTDNSEHVLSITATIGFQDQREKFSRVIAGQNLERYIRLFKGEFAYNKGNSDAYPQGCVYRLEEFEEGAVPNVYYCFRPSSPEIDSDFYKYYFEAGILNDKLRPLINTGVRNDGLLNLSSDKFFGIEIEIPPLDEQRQIAGLLDSLSAEIKLLIEKERVLQQQKKGLMQRLLTGQIRVRV